MRKTAFLAALLLSVLASAQPKADTLYRVSADSLIRHLRSSYGLKVYAEKDTSDNRDYIVRAPREEFPGRAFKALEEAGYIITDYDGGHYVLRNMGFNTGLPFGFFQKEEKADDGALLKYAGEQAVSTTFQNKIYEIGDRGPIRSGKAAVSGCVRDVKTGEPITGVSVYDDKGAYAITDAGGFYRIMLPYGENRLNFSGYSLEDMKFDLIVFDQGGFDVNMKERVFALTGAVVTSEGLSRHRVSKMGIETVRANVIKNVPVAFGEADLIKVVMTLPGVKTVGEASNGFNVRGGSTDQNLILFNNGTIYNPNHAFGILSAFNTDVISDVELYKSSIPVEYGGRISSVLEIRSREGNSKKFAGSLGLGLLTSRLHLEGPLSRSGKTTFILGARTTYSDWLLGLLPKNSNYANGTATFGDINLGISHKLNTANSLQAYGYWSADRFRFSNDTSFRYRNASFSLKWRSNFSDRHSAVTVAGYDSYAYHIDDTFEPPTSYRLSSGIDQAYVKSTFKSALSDRHNLTYGLGTTYYRLNAGTVSTLGDESLVIPRALPLENALESALFAGDAWTLNDRISFDAGVRLSHFASLDDGTTYLNPELRLSGKYSFNDHFSWKAGFNTMHQYIQKISDCVNISPTDTWKLCNADIQPQNGWQAATGLYATVAKNTLDLTMEAYYKHVDHFVDYRSGAQLVMNPKLADELVNTECRAWGVELMARRNVGKINGWVSYTYSRSMQRATEDDGLQTINGGRWYASSFDKPHDFKLVGNYKLTHRYSISANLDYSTGRPVTIPVSKYYYSGAYRLQYSERNGYRIPDYFRLDLAMNIEPGHYLKQLTHMSVTFGVYNVTGRKNAYSVYYTSDENLVKGHMLSVLATQIPYINLNLKF